jgi:glycosyltransferase involved in cell wall biosynthesis
MKCGIPILSGNLTSLPEVAGEAAIYCDPYDVSAITAGMHILANDADIRERLKQAGIGRGKLFSWDHTAAACWKAILEC